MRTVEMELEVGLPVRIRIRAELGEHRGASPCLRVYYKYDKLPTDCGGSDRPGCSCQSGTEYRAAKRARAVSLIFFMCPDPTKAFAVFSVGRRRTEREGPTSLLGCPSAFVYYCFSILSELMKHLPSVLS